MRNIANQNNWLIICLGLVMAFFVIAGNLNDSEPTIVDQEDQQETVLTEQSYEAVQAASQASVERNSYLIEILPDFEIQETERIEIKHFLPSLARVFEVVFEHIISPNSP